MVVDGGAKLERVGRSGGDDDGGTTLEDAVEGADARDLSQMLHVQQRLAQFLHAKKSIG